METKLYQEFAQRIQAKKHCEQKENVEWQTKHTIALEKLIDLLPHGSGLDYEWTIDYDKSNAEKVVLTMAYHAMDEMGGYDKVIYFTLTITPSLIHGFNLAITGNFGKYQDVKEYLYDILGESLSQTIDTNLVL